MSLVTLGRTKITVNKNGFGALPIQRITKEEAAYLLRKAYDAGITFFDTARGYTDSEEKLSMAFRGIRDKLYIATKTPSISPEGFEQDLETSLRLLGTDYIDLYQFHNPPFCPKEGDGTGLYEAALKAKKEGKIRFIGITNHRLLPAMKAVKSGLYDTLQFPFSYLASEKELALVDACRSENVGFIAMKALAGGLITNSAAAYAYLDQYEHILPIWGVQRERELDEFISYVKKPPVMTKELLEVIERDRRELKGNFCRGCGYCMPCPVGIEIPTCARMSLLIRRSPAHLQLTESAREMMGKIKDCIECGQCKSRCPYGLDTPSLLRENAKDYQEIYRKSAENIII